MDVKTLVMDDLTVLRHITTNRCNICEKAVELMDQFLCYFIETYFFVHVWSYFAYLQGAD